MGDEERGVEEGGRMRRECRGRRWEDSKGWKREGDWRVEDAGRAREGKGEY